MPKFYGLSLQFKNGVFKIGYEPHSVGQPIPPKIVVSKIEEEKPIQPSVPIEPIEPSTPDTHNYLTERVRYYIPLNCDHGFAYKTEQRKHLRKFAKSTLYANMARLSYEERGDWPILAELDNLISYLRYYEIDSSKWLTASHIDETKRLITKFYNRQSLGARGRYGKIAKQLGITTHTWARISRCEKIDPTLMPSDEVMLRHRALQPYLNKITEPA